MLNRREAILFGLVASAGVVVPKGVRAEERRIITREEWGALEPTKDKHRVLYTNFLDFSPDLVDFFGVDSTFDRNMLEWFAIHHSGRGGIAPVERIQRVHMRKMSDIAYNWIIDREGMIYEGRPWFTMAAAVGASVESRAEIEEFGKLVHPELSPNYGCLNVCLLGDFTRTKPTEEQVDSLYFLTRFVARFFGNVGAERIIGHKDNIWMAEERGLNLTVEEATRCPGDIEDLIIGSQIRFLMERDENPYKLGAISEEYETFIDFGERSIPIYRGTV
jgi:hypothetical protein